MLLVSGWYQEPPKSLSRKPPPDQERGSEIDECEVVLRLLLPPYKQLPAAIEPGRSTLGDPPSRSSTATTLAPLLTAPADVRYVAPTANSCSASA